MSLARGKPPSRLSTFTMEISDHNDDFQEELREYIYRISRCSTRSQAVVLRTNALRLVDQWRAQRLEQLDQHVRLAGQWILQAYDQRPDRQPGVKCPHRALQTIPNISVNRLRSSMRLSPVNLDERKAFTLAEFGRDFTFETLAYLPPSSVDTAMVICDDSTLIYSRYANELVIVSLHRPQEFASLRLDTSSTIRELVYIAWLSQCLVITDEQILLLDYRTTEAQAIESGTGYISGAVDNIRSVLYLVKQSTLCKYDQSALVNLHIDQYPIADGYRAQCTTLDERTNDYLALLVLADDEKNYILVYSTRSLADGYLYQVVIDDCIERRWICSNGDYGWLVAGTRAGSCFDLNSHGLSSVRVFDSDEIRKMIAMPEHRRFVIRTRTDIFVLMRYPCAETF